MLKNSQKCQETTPRTNTKKLRVKSINEINALAEESMTEINPKIPIDSYYDELRSIFIKYKGIRKSEDMELQYLYLYLYINMILKRIPEHPQFTRSSARFKVFRTNVYDVLGELEMLKKSLNMQYNEIANPLKNRIKKVEKEELEEEEEEGERKKVLVGEEVDPYSYYKPEEIEEGIEEKPKKKLPPPPKKLLKKDEQQKENIEENKAAKQTAKFLMYSWKGLNKLGKQVGKGLSDVFKETTKLIAEEKSEKKMLTN